MSFDIREGAPYFFSRMLPLLGLAENATARQACAWWAIKQVEAGLAGGGVQGMCGRHSKDQCTPAGFGSVERATEVVARPSRGSIPPLCGGLLRRPVRRCSSLQFSTNQFTTIIPKEASAKIRKCGMEDSASDFDGSGATPGWPGFLLDIVGVTQGV